MGLTQHVVVVKDKDNEKMQMAQSLKVTYFILVNYCWSLLMKLNHSKIMKSWNKLFFHMQMWIQKHNTTAPMGPQGDFHKQPQLHNHDLPATSI